MRKNKKDIEDIPKALRMDNTEKKKKKNFKKVLLVLVIGTVELWITFDFRQKTTLFQR